MKLIQEKGPSCILCHPFTYERGTPFLSDLNVGLEECLDVFLLHGRKERRIPAQLGELAVAVQPVQQLLSREHPLDSKEWE